MQRSNRAEHNVLRTARRRAGATIKDDISAKTCVGYDDINTDENQLTYQCVENIIELTQLRQLSIGIVNFT
jgi:hypothetical protein